MISSIVNLESALNQKKQHSVRPDGGGRGGRKSVRIILVELQRKVD